MGSASCVWCRLTERQTPITNSPPRPHHLNTYPKAGEGGGGGPEHPLPLTLHPRPLTRVQVHHDLTGARVLVVLVVGEGEGHGCVVHHQVHVTLPGRRRADTGDEEVVAVAGHGEDAGGGVIGLGVTSTAGD